MDEYLTRAEHNEFAKRVEEEQVRQNHRLTSLEDSVSNIQRLTISVEKMSVNMEHMANKQGEMSKKLDELESEPADNWKTVKSAIIGAIASGIGVAILAALLYFAR